MKILSDLCGLNRKNYFKDEKLSWEETPQIVDSSSYAARIVKNRMGGNKYICACLYRKR